MINILPKDLVNKIAAGEVVERPSSVVKELVENAMDAGASRIILRIKNGGMDEITVEDNGIGIEKHDIEKIFYNHATSKITDTGDLEHIVTFGFRGEALASIASVSKITLITKHKNDEEATKVMLQDGVSKVFTAAANTGTSICVENLFYNIPARRKYLKSEKTESSYITKMYQEIAMAHPEIEFGLINNGKQSFIYHAGTIDERIKQIAKIEFLPQTTLYQSEKLTISGMLLPPGSLENSSMQHIYVNKRPISSAIIAKAVKEAYISYLRKDIKPSFILFIEISPELVDVNVHPRKTEVRFLDQHALYSIVYKAVASQFEKLHSIKSIVGDTFPQNFPAQYAGTNLRDIQVNDKPISMGSYTKPSSIGNSKDALNFTKLLFDAPEKAYNTENVSFDDPFDGSDFLQIDKKFIVFQSAEGITIIDQHAAAERVNYERLYKAYQEKNLDMTILLIPYSLELSSGQYESVIALRESFEMYGFYFDDLGNDIISITKIPVNITSDKIENVFYEMLESFMGDDHTGERLGSIDEKIVASIACRSAIMFGQKLSLYEMKELVKSLYLCTSPFTCAHGRPLRYVLTYSDLLKKLGRC